MICFYHVSETPYLPLVPFRQPPSLFFWKISLRNPQIVFVDAIMEWTIGGFCLGKEWFKEMIYPILEITIVLSSQSFKIWIDFFFHIHNDVPKLSPLKLIFKLAQGSYPSKVVESFWPLENKCVLSLSNSMTWSSYSIITIIDTFTSLQSVAFGVCVRCKCREK